MAPGFPREADSEGSAGGILLFDALAVGLWYLLRFCFVLHTIQYLRETAGKVVQSFDVQCHQYTDYMQCYLSFLSNSKEVVSVLLRGLCECALMG